MVSNEENRRAKALQDEYREIYKTFPQENAFSAWDDIMSYVKLGVFFLELPLIAYYTYKCVSKEKQQYRKLRAQARAAAAA